MLNLDTMVDVGGKSVSVRDLLIIDDADLVAMYAEQASRYAYFAVLADTAEYAWSVARDACKQIEAGAFIDYKADETQIPKGSRSVSDKLAQSLVDADDECIAARSAEMIAMHKFHLMRSLARSFQQRADMLQSMGAHLRHEADMDGIGVREPDVVSDLRRKTADKR